MPAPDLSQLLTSPSTEPLVLGASGTVAGFADAAIAGKLLAMGVLPGARIQLVRKAPFGGAVYITVNDHCLALREAEFAAIAIRQ